MTCSLDIIHYILGHRSVVKNIWPFFRYLLIGVSKFGKSNDIIFLQEVFV